MYGCGQQEVGVASGSGWNLWMWLAGDGCEWNLWVWLVGVDIYRFPHITYPYSSCTYLFFFAAASLLFIKIFLLFFVLVKITIIHIYNVPFIYMILK